MHSPSVSVHDEGETSEIESVLFGRETLSESVGDVVRGEESDDHDSELDGDEGERDDEPSLEEHVLEIEVRTFTSWDRSSRVAPRRDRRFHEGRVVSTALELGKVEIENKMTKGQICEGNEEKGKET